MTQESYRAAGVDLDGADAHTARIAPLVTATWNETVVGGFGGFAAGVEIPDGYRRPVLMMSTDGVGTKLELARRTGRWDGVGFDLVAMCVDDLVVAGAKPLAFVDYLALGSLQAERDAAIVGSVARACAAAECALVGGETAEHPGVMEPDAVDMAGAAVGVVERGAELGPHLVEEGDVVIGLRSPNLRSNGFSLVRKVFADDDLDATFPKENVSLGEVLLRPSVIYAPVVLSAIGGLEANVARSMPDGLTAKIDHDSWEWPAVFTEVQSRGNVSTADMRRTFNLGIGFCLVVDPKRVDEVLAVSAEHQPRPIGRISAAS